MSHLITPKITYTNCNTHSGSFAVEKKPKTNKCQINCEDQKKILKQKLTSFQTISIFETTGTMSAIRRHKSI